MSFAIPMKERECMQTFLRTAVVVISGLASTCAFAGAMVGNTSAWFSPPASDSGGYYALLPGYEADQTLVTGSAAGPGETPSIVSLSNAYTNSGLDKPFQFASVTYTNGVNLYDSVIDSIPLNLGLTMYDTPMCFYRPSQFVQHQFDLDISATPNVSGDADADADALILSGQTKHYFSAFGKQFVLEILGFSDDGTNFCSQFVVPERSTLVTGMYARVMAVPEPSSLLLGGMGCLAMIGCVARKRITKHHHN